MSEETWTKSFEIISKVSPMCRVDICLGGEPTLNKNLPDFLKIAREISPLSQIQITTNGTTLIKGEVTYKQLFESGANIVYTDMYGPKEKFLQMAKESGYYFYEYYNTEKKEISPWTYHANPTLKMIVLQEQPENWPKSRQKAGLLGTWYNHLDWEAAAEFGLSKVETPPRRRCNQPFEYVPVHYSGEYLLCCQDNMGESAGVFGSVHEGEEGFKKYWFGKNLQTIRRRLREKNRVDTTYCSRCCITFSRCDYRRWKDEEVGKYWDGKKWNKLPEEVDFDRFADHNMVKNKGFFD